VGKNEKNRGNAFVFAKKPLNLEFDYEHQAPPGA
jgi:hypothetical protein